MRLLNKIACSLFCILSVVVAAAGAFLWFAYQVIDEGEFYLPNAPGNAAILRESDTGIPHIRGDSYLSVIYAQGFAHAQTRLWQLERTRRVIRGEISELFGEDTLKLDIFMRKLGLRRLAEQSLETMGEREKATIQAYADGINDCVFGTSMVLKSTTQRLLPPEFYAFGLSDLSEWRPWHPTDTLALIKYKSFYLSWNWMHDLGREALRQKHPDLADIVEEINPFKSEDFIDMVTILDESDLKKEGHYDEKSLLEKYHEAADLIKSASPPLSPDVPSEKLRASAPASEKKRKPTKA